MSTAFDSTLDSLRAGETVLVPTDTVYGLAALPGSAGYDRIFELKQRPVGQTLPWLVSSLEMFHQYADAVPSWADCLASAFWPGALTLVVGASNKAKLLGRPAPDGTIAFRIPDEPLVRKLIQELGCPIACTSANLHGMPAQRDFSALDARFRELAYPFDDAYAPRCAGGCASTIVDCSGEGLRVLREGPISEEGLLAVAKKSHRP